MLETPSLFHLVPLPDLKKGMCSLYKQELEKLIEIVQEGLRSGSLKSHWKTGKTRLETDCHGENLCNHVLPGMEKQENHLFSESTLCLMH